MIKIYANEIFFFIVTHNNPSISGLKRKPAQQQRSTLPATPAHNATKYILRQNIQNSSVYLHFAPANHPTIKYLTQSSRFLRLFRSTHRFVYQHIGRIKLARLAPGRFSFSRRHNK